MMKDKKIKTILLILLNMFLYFIYSKTFFFLLFSSITTYFLVKKTAQKKNIFFIFLAYFLLLCPFIFFKYIIPFYEFNLLIPLGISYYTLSLFSYITDVLKKRYPASNNFLDFLLFSTYFPCLIIGPIIRYNDFDSQIQKISYNSQNTLNSIMRISIGLIKKLIIANKLNVVIFFLKANLDYQGVYVLLGTLLFSILLYCDFSGGIDIVLGISKMFNIDLKENFNHPFKSETVKEFWQRWHISLGNWLRDYVYIPLGGNRVNTFMTKVNVLVTFIISGLWHGINYLLWGIINGMLVMINLKTKYKILNCCLTFLLISLLWVFFIYQDPFVSLERLGTIFTKFNVWDLKNFFHLGLNILDYFVICVFFFSVLYYENKNELILKYIKKKSIYYQIVIVLIIVLLILVFGRYGLDVNSNNFIYESF